MKQILLYEVRIAADFLDDKNSDNWAAFFGEMWEVWLVLGDSLKSNLAPSFLFRFIKEEASVGRSVLLKQQSFKYNVIIIIKGEMFEAIDLNKSRP